MIPILFESTAEDFSRLGIGPLTDAIGPHVTEELNGAYVLDMQYPLSGVHFGHIGRRSIILAKPNPADDLQPFRVTKITRPINGIVSIHAEHISYDLKGIPILPFSAPSVTAAMFALQNNTVTPNPFTMWSSLDRIGQLEVRKPVSVRSVMGSGEAGVLSVYGGEYHYDGFRVELVEARGRALDKVIHYGVDLIDLQQEENCEKVYSGVLPFWQKNDTAVYGDVQSVGGLSFSRILPVDLSSNFETPPTKAQVNQAGLDYIEENNIAVPEISLSVKFAQLAETETMAALQEIVSLGDELGVEFGELGVSAKARVIKTDFDVLTERYLSVDVGDPRPNIADTIAGIGAAVQTAPTSSEMSQAIQAATALLTGVDGGNVLWRFDNSGRPTDLLFMDTDDEATARNVLRINRNGIGFSTNGVNGPFDTAWTISGLFYASHIVAGTITGDKIQDLSITNQKVANATIQNGKIANSTIQGGKIASGTITSGNTNSYINTGIANGYDAADVMAGNTYAVALGANVFRCPAGGHYRLGDYNATWQSATIAGTTIYYLGR